MSAQTCKALSSVAAGVDISWPVMGQVAEVLPLLLYCFILHNQSNTVNLSFTPECTFNNGTCNANGASSNVPMGRCAMEGIVLHMVFIILHNYNVATHATVLICLFS